jgi:hypothetical protein
VTVGPYKIESEAEADNYLLTMFTDLRLRSMHEVRFAARDFITDEVVKAHFLRREAEMLQAYGGNT